MIRWLARVPLGVRIAALTSATLLAILVVVGVLMHHQFGRALRNDIDAELRDLARTAAERDDLQGTELPPDLSIGWGRDAPAPPEAEMQLIEDGVVVASSDGLSGTPSLVRGGALIRVASGVPVSGDASVGGSLYRFAGVSLGAESDRIVVVAAPIPDVREAEETLLQVYVPLTVAAGVVAAIAGAIIASVSLAPLRRFASEADAIGSLDLSQRLSTPPSADEVGRLGTTLNTMLERLEAALGRERQLTAEVGHELRTPLAIIRAEVELLQGLITDPAASASLKSILEEVDRTTGVIDDMLLLARADANAALDRFDLVELGRTARTIVDRFSPLAAARGVSLTASGDGRVQGDPRAIERSIANLVDNALRHTPAGGAVEIEVEDGGGGPQVSVLDSGPGAPEAALETMFDRYTSAGPQRGAAGLGLSIVAAVAASHGGRVRARNRPEGGLEITIQFSRTSEMETSTRS